MYLSIREHIEQELPRNRNLIYLSNSWSACVCIRKITSVIQHDTVQSLSLRESLRNLILFQHGTQLTFSNDPMEVTRKADAIITDTWVSMGQEDEKAIRMKDFKGYQVNQKVSYETLSRTAIKFVCDKMCHCHKRINIWDTPPQQLLLINQRPWLISTRSNTQTHPTPSKLHLFYLLK